MAALILVFLNCNCLPTIPLKQCLPNKYRHFEVRARSKISGVADLKAPAKPLSVATVNSGRFFKK